MNADFDAMPLSTAAGTGDIVDDNVQGKPVILQYVVGPAAEQTVLGSRVTSDNCTVVQPSTDNDTAVSYPAVTPDASAVSSEDTSADRRLDPGVVSMDTGDLVAPMTVTVGQFPVADPAVVVRKKRGRKPKRRRRTQAANPPPCPPQHPVNTPSQTNLDYCNSVAADERPPAPKKRGRKPKQRPEVVTVVVDDAGVECGRSSLEGSEAPMTSSTALSAVDEDKQTNKQTNDVDSVTNSGSGDVTQRRRGRKRKDTALDKDDSPREKVDEDRVQSVWKVTSPASEYSGNVVPRIKVTNVRVSTESAGTGSELAAAATSSVGQTVTRNRGSGGRQGVLMAKSWQPIVRRTDVSDGKTTVPVLERAQEWIHATPKPSRDDWTGPVFPAREVIHAQGTGSPPARQVPAKSPVKSVVPGYVDHHVGLSAGGDAVGRRVLVPGDAIKSHALPGQRHPSVSAVAVNAASVMTYVRDGPSVASARSLDHKHVPGINSVRPVYLESPTMPTPCSTFDNRQLLSASVCRFANAPRTGQYMTKRVSRRLGCATIFDFVLCIVCFLVLTKLLALSSDV